MKLKLSKFTIVIIVLALVTLVVGYVWTKKALTPDEKLEAAAAQMMGMSVEVLAEANELIERARTTRQLSASDRERVRELLASDSPDLRRYGLIALNCGSSRTEPQVVINVATKTLSDKNARLRATAVRILFELDQEHWHDHAAKLRNDESKTIRDMVSSYSVQHDSTEHEHKDGER